MSARFFIFSQMSGHFSSTDEKFIMDCLVQKNLNNINKIYHRNYIRKKEKII